MKRFFVSWPPLFFLVIVSFLIAGHASALSYTKIVSEGNGFTVSGTKTVSYGAGSSWINKVVSGGGSCTNSFFGRDPSPYRVKICSIREGSATSTQSGKTPTLVFKAKNKTLDYNDKATLTWVSTNTTSCATPWGVLGTSGKRVTSKQTEDKKWRMTCTGPFGSVTDTASIEVGEKAVSRPEITLSAASQTIDFQSTAFISWSATRATSCTSSWGGSGTSGTYTTPALDVTTSYSVTCQGEGGTRTKSITITVLPEEREDGTATAVTLSGPVDGTINVASSNFTVGANGTIAGTVTVTPSDGADTGTFSPTTVNLTSGSPTATFTYTPDTTGSKTISITNNGGLSNPSSLTYTSNAVTATAVTLSGPVSGPVNVASSNFTVSANGAISGTVTITPSDGADTGTFSPTTVNLTSGSSTATFTYTPDTTGTKTISITNNGGLTNSGSPISYTSTAVSNGTPFLNARTGLRYATLGQAVTGSISGDTIKVSAGTYVISAFGDNDPGMTRIAGGINLHTLTIEWETPGVMPVIDMSAYAFRDASQGGRTVGLEAGPNNRSLTVRGLHLIGSQHDPSGGGDNASYGINSLQGYLENVGHNGDPASTLNIEFCKLEKWGDGVKNTIYNYNLTTNVRYTTIEDSTANTKTHGIYVNGDVLNVLGSTIRTTVAGRAQLPENVGHLIKSRTRTTTVRGSLLDGAGGSATNIELPNGGTLVVEGNIILHYGQTLTSDENSQIKFGAEQRAVGGFPSWDGRVHSIKIAQNTFRKDQPGWDNSQLSLRGPLSVSASMTLEDGTPLPPASIPTVVQNNIAAGVMATRFVTDYPNNTGNLDRNTVSDVGVYSGAAVAGDPLVNDAAYAWVGEFQEPASRTDTYRGGRIEGYPAWRSDMIANTWKAIGTSSINDVNPAFNAAINPFGSSSNSPWRGSDGQRAVIRGWGSAVWDEATRALWIPNGGGHGNYGGNEAYKQILNDAVPVWTMPRNPSGAIGNTITLEDGQESTGVYADGRPRSTHAYNNVVYAPGVGPVIVRSGSVYPGSGGSHKVFKLDPTTGETTLVYEFSGQGLANPINGASCYDSLRNRIYSIGTNNSAHLLYVTPSTASTWTGGSVGPHYGSDGPQGMVYIPTIDRILHVSLSQGVLYHKLINPVTAASTSLGAISSGSLAAGFTFGTMPGLEWSPELGKVLLWNNASNTAQISTLTYPGDLTSAWPVGTLTVSGANTVTPPSNAMLNGVFGLLRYSSALRGLMLITDHTNPTYFYATE